MKNLYNYCMLLFFVVLLIGFSGCSDNELKNLEENDIVENICTQTLPLNFIGSVVGYDQSNSERNDQTRSASSSWKDGDKIYITFYNESSIVAGIATYSSASGWSVSYDGNLATGVDLKCEARFFVNDTFSSSSLVSLNSNSEIYEDLDALYTYNNGSLTVHASMTPKTGRIRFTGKSSAKIYTTGITFYTTFSPAINTFSTSKAMITSDVASNGSTPYIYGYFSSSDRSLGLVGSDFAYTRTCTSDMFNKGESGYMAIPSESSHNNWRSGLYVKASGVEFKMIPVAGYTGGFFMIGETEVTEELYRKIDANSSVSSQLPISNITYNSVISFIEKLNNETKLNFNLPTAEQWQYVAKGGNKSQDYIYAGSNTPGDVAWYAANTSKKQEVKTKAPNELGIYDMSGNVAEFVIHSGIGYYNYYGGSYISSSTGITVSSKEVSSSNYPSWSSVQVGFRLIMTCP